MVHRQNEGLISVLDGLFPRGVRRAASLSMYILACLYYFLFLNAIKKEPIV